MKKFYIVLLMYICCISGCSGKKSEEVTEYDSAQYLYNLSKVKSESDETEDYYSFKYDPDITYPVPDYRSAFEESYDEYYLDRLVEENADDWFEQWNYHVWNEYYKISTPSDSDWDYADEEDKYEDDELEQYQIDAGIVDFNMFY